MKRLTASTLATLCLIAGGLGLDAPSTRRHNDKTSEDPSLYGSRSHESDRARGEL